MTLCVCVCVYVCVCMCMCVCVCELVHMLFLTNQGVVHFGSEVLSWQPLANVWLASRTGVERTCLRKQFATFMGPVTKMVCRGNR